MTNTRKATCIVVGLTCGLLAFGGSFFLLGFLVEPARQLINNILE